MVNMCECVCVSVLSVCVDGEETGAAGAPQLTLRVVAAAAAAGSAVAAAWVDLDFLLLTNVAVRKPLVLLHSDDIPDAGEPVRRQRKGEHQQSQNHGRVLWISINFLQ